MENFIRHNKQTAIYLVSLWGVILATFLGGTNLYHRIMDIRDSAKKNQSELNRLENKLQTLSDAQAGSISLSAAEATEALPASSSTMSLVLHLRRLSESNSLSLKSMALLPENRAVADMSQSGIEITVQGELDNITQFVSDLERIKPLTNLRSIEFSRKFGESAITADISLLTFWSSLPEELPAVSQNITGLTQAEESALNIVSQYASPITFQQTTNVDFAPKENPFSLGSL